MTIVRTSVIGSRSLALAFLFVASTDVSCETVTTSSLIPAPSGVYKRLVTTGNTILARDGGDVLVGASVPPAWMGAPGLNARQTVVSRFGSFVAQGALQERGNVSSGLMIGNGSRGLFGMWHETSGNNAVLSSFDGATFRISAQNSGNSQSNQFVISPDSNVGYYAINPNTNFYISNSFVVQGEVGFNRGLWVTGDMRAGRSLSVGGNGDFGGSIWTQGSGNFSGNVGVGNSVFISNNIYINNCAYVAGTGYGNCGSDARLKKNITPVGDSLDAVAALRPVRFDWKSQDFPDRKLPRGRQWGLIAQEVEKVLPELVGADKDGFKTVNLGPLTMLAIQAIKELREENAALSARIAALEQGRPARVKTGKMTPSSSSAPDPDAPDELYTLPPRPTPPPPFVMPEFPVPAAPKGFGSSE